MRSQRFELKIAVNTRFLLPNKLEGFGWYTYETLSRITRQHPEHEFIFFFDRAFDERFVFADNVTPVVLNPQARHPILFKIWFNYSVTRALKKYQPDVFVSTDGYLSLKTNTKQLAVIHDLNFEHHPEDLKPIHTKYLKKYFPLFAEKADRILTVSHYSKADIVQQYGVSESKIDVAWNGAAPIFKPVSDNEQSAVRAKHTNGKPYFVYVGALHPRKNIRRLFEAFDAFKEQQDGNHQLVIVGEKYYWPEELESTFQAMKHKTDVVFTGRLEAEDLNRVVASAMAMTYVSYFEGFGIPIAEAFKAGTPVISGNLTSLPEVAGDATLLVDPYNVEEIAAAMIRLAKDDQLREELTQKGLERGQLFDWQNSADGLWESIQKCTS